MREVFVQSGQDVASALLVRQITRAGVLGALAILALSITQAISAGGRWWQMVLIGLIVAASHGLVCGHLRAYARQLASKTKAPVAIPLAPQIHMRRAQLRWAGHLGNALVVRLLAALVVLVSDLLTLPIAIFAAFALEGLSGPVRPVELLGSLCIGGVLQVVCVWSARACLDQAHKQLMRAVYEQHTIVQVRAARQAQGGALSAPVEASAGELSVVHEQRGGLAVHEANAWGSDAEVVLGSEASAREEVVEVVESVEAASVRGGR